jgi:hypothetical protein
VVQHSLTSLRTGEDLSSSTTATVDCSAGSPALGPQLRNARPTQPQYVELSEKVILASEPASREGLF